MARAPPLSSRRRETDPSTIINSPPQADCHAHEANVEEDHELGECHAHVSPKFVRKFHARVEGEKHEHPPGTYNHHNFVSTVPIYARIPANQTDLTPGTYADTITVTITF